MEIKIPISMSARITVIHLDDEKVRQDGMEPTIETYKQLKAEGKLAKYIISKEVFDDI